MDVEYFMPAHPPAVNTMNSTRNRVIAPASSMMPHPVNHIFDPMPSTLSSARAGSPYSTYNSSSSPRGGSPTTHDVGPYQQTNPGLPISPRSPISPRTPGPLGASSGGETERENRYEGRRNKWITDVKREEEVAAERLEQERDDALLRQQIEANNMKIMEAAEHLAPVDSSEFFMNSPKFILYALRTYCLTKPVPNFKNLFMQYDEDSNGTLDCEEIWHGICRLGFNITKETAAEVLNMMDLDGNCELDFAEFRCAILDERIAMDFEDHARRMHNDCKLQEAYRLRCLKPPHPASLVGPAAIPFPTAGHNFHMDILAKQKEGIMPVLSAKEKAKAELEAKRLELQNEMAAKRDADKANHGAKQSMEQQKMSEMMNSKFGNMRKAFSQMDTDGSGFLDRGEMAALCTKLNLPPNWVEPLINDADVDGDGEISYIEFAKALERKSQLGDHDADQRVKHSSAELMSEYHEGPDEEFQAHIFGEVMGNTNYREGPAVPAALPLAGGWKQPTRRTLKKEPLLFSAHASHLTRTVSGVVEDGVSVCCTRKLSHHIKQSAPNFLQ
jgi:Ca2+-binding EF-hand superfamily protein